MKKRFLIRTALLASLGLFIATSAIAGPHHWGGRQAWNNAGIEACAGKAEGDKVQWTTPRGRTMEAVCLKAPDGTLHARPEAAGKYHQAMVAACNGKKAGDTVQIETPCGIPVDGICTQQGNNLVANLESGYPCGGWHQGYGRGHGWKGHRRGCAGYGDYAPCGAYYGPGYGAGQGMGYGFIQNACQGKNKGEKVSLETPCGATVDITCGGAPSGKPASNK